jgi:DNA topoisomerase-1
VEKMGELRVSNVIAAIDEALSPHLFPEKADGGDPRVCPSCSTGRLSLKTGKFGAFIGCSNYPDCRYTRPLAAPDADGEAAAPSLDGKVLGVDDRTGEEITLRSGRFGPYVQRGEGESLKRASLPKGWTPEALDLEKALRLLSLPREVGAHPEDGAMILANIGRYGPYLQHAKTYANLPGVDDVFEIGLNRAVTLIAEKRAGGGRPQRGAPAALRELGAHPVSGVAIKVFSGRYGPYVADGTTNATLPKGADPAAVTLEEAVQLIDARAAAAPAKGKKPARKAAAPKAKPAGKAKPRASAKKAAPKA